jgi:hypothetical protein
MQRRLLLLLLLLLLSGSRGSLPPCRTAVVAPTTLSCCKPCSMQQQGFARCWLNPSQQHCQQHSNTPKVRWWRLMALFMASCQLLLTSQHNPLLAQACIAAMVLRGTVGMAVSHWLYNLKPVLKEALHV